MLIQSSYIQTRAGGLKSPCLCLTCIDYTGKTPGATTVMTLQILDPRLRGDDG